MKHGRQGASLASGLAAALTCAACDPAPVAIGDTITAAAPIVTPIATGAEIGRAHV